MDGEITIEATEKQWVRVKAGKSVFRLAAFLMKNFRSAFDYCFRRYG